MCETPLHVAADLEPVFEPGTLFTLGEELESQQVATSVARTYLRLLADRVGRVEAALTTGDVDGALEVLLSLRATSGTVGARRLAARATLVIDALDRGDTEHTWECLGDLARDTAETEAALTLHLSGSERG
jgi:HPt (histidine-containing phosphotransfer) domain-containing protein